jgi:hypothetical protein
MIAMLRILELKKESFQISCLLLLYYAATESRSQTPPFRTRDATTNKLGAAWPMNLLSFTINGEGKMTQHEENQCA